MKGFSVKITGIDKMLKTIQHKQKAPEIVDDELSAGALDMVRVAKRYAPVDEGLLRNEIGANITGPKKQFFVAVYYAAYMEFGTKSKVSIPAGYADFARQFKGKAGRGGVQEMLKALTGWVKRKGLSGTYSTKTRRRTGSSANRIKEDEQVAFLIMRHILKYGIKPHPFFIPAYKEVQPKMLKRIYSEIKKL